MDHFFFLDNFEVEKLFLSTLELIKYKKYTDSLKHELTCKILTRGWMLFVDFYTLTV